MKNRFLQLGLVLLIALASCNKNDGYSLGDFRINVATVHKLSESVYSLTLDNGIKLWPAASDVRYNPKDSQRVFVNYTILSDQYGNYDHAIKINDIWNILTKNIVDLTSENESDIGHDPIRIHDVWIANDFLNIGFLFNYSGIRPHAINLVKNQITQETNGEEVVELEFRHNAFNGGSNRLFDGLVCFNLRPIRRKNIDSVKLRITYKDFPKNGEPITHRNHELYYKYNSLSTNNVQFETPVLVVKKDEYY